MSRVKWLASTWDCSLRDLAAGMLAHSYDEGRDEGYFVSKSTTKVVEGRHVAKRVVVDIVEDPLGGTREERRIVFDQTKFEIRQDARVGLALTDSPRSIRPFLNSLHVIADFQFSVSELSVDPLEWWAIVEKTLSKGEVVQIDATDVRIEKAVGSLSVKGKTDVRREFARFLGSSEKKITAIKVSYRSRGGLEVVELRRNGVAVSPREFGQDGREAFRIALEELVGRGAAEL